MATKRYTVIGTQPVLDHHPGESFEADIPEVEEFLLSIGAIKVDGVSGEELKALKEPDVQRIVVDSHKKRNADRD